MPLISRHEVTVEWGDCDPAGIVYYPAYFRWSDQATYRLFLAAGLKRDDVSSGQWKEGTPLVAAECSFKRAVAARREAGDREPRRAVRPQLLHHPPRLPQRGRRGRGRGHRDADLGAGRKAMRGRSRRSPFPEDVKTPLGRLSDASKRRADSHHPCRQPAARSRAVGPADPRRGGRDGRSRRAGAAAASRRCATWCDSRRPAAST